MLNLPGRNANVKPNNIGANLGSTSITSVGKSIALSTNQNKPLASFALKDAVTVKTLLDNQLNQTTFAKSPTEKQNKLNTSNRTKNRRPSNTNNTSFDKKQTIDSYRNSSKVVAKEDFAKASKSNYGYFYKESLKSEEQYLSKNVINNSNSEFTPNQNEKENIQNLN